MERGFKVIGIDYSEKMLEKAKELVPNAEFMKMDIRDLKFDENTFDGIINQGVLPHIEKSELEAVFSESYRVLKPNGILFLATRSAEMEKTIIEEATEGGEMKVIYHTLKTVKETLTKDRFEIMEAYEMQDGIGRPFKYMYVSVRARK